MYGKCPAMTILAVASKRNILMDYYRLLIPCPLGRGRHEPFALAIYVALTVPQHQLAVAAPVFVQPKAAEAKPARHLTPRAVAVQRAALHRQGNGARHLATPHLARR